MRHLQRPRLRRVAILLLTLVTTALLLRQHPHLGDLPASADGQGPPEGSAAFSVSDLSILVPLQAAPQAKASDSLFGQTGTGFCHAWPLDLGGLEPVMSPRQWQDWAKEALYSIQPLPVNAAAWQGRSPDQAAKQRLQQEILSLPDFDAPGGLPGSSRWRLTRAGRRCVARRRHQCRDPPVAAAWGVHLSKLAHRQRPPGSLSVQRERFSC